MDENGNPIVTDPGDGGGEPAPVDNGGGDQGGTHLQPGQSPTDLDFDAILDEAEAAEKAEQDAETQRLADEQAAKDQEESDKAAAEQADRDKAEADAKAESDRKAAEAAAIARGEKPNPVDPTQMTDSANIDNYFDTGVDENYGIAPIPEIRNPEEGETSADYFKAVFMPAILQAQKNQVGFAQRNMDLQNSESVEQDNQRTTAMLGDIDSLVSGKSIPAYTLDANGQMDPNSEGGKAVAEMLRMANEHNSKPENANNKITSLKLAYHELYKPAQEQAAKDAAGKAADERRRGAANVLSGTGRSGAPGQSTGARRSVRRPGQSVADLDFDALTA